MAAISAIITFYQGSVGVLKQFRSRIPLQDNLGSFNNFKYHTESVKEKAREHEVNCSELKLFCQARSTTGANYYKLSVQCTWLAIRLMVIMVLQIAHRSLQWNTNDVIQ